MHRIKSISSHLMTPLLSVRNPGGKEKNWYPNEGRIRGSYDQCGRKVFAAVGLALIVMTATVESVAYGALSLISLAFTPLSLKPKKLCFSLLNSSAFTLGWALSNLFVGNFLYSNLHTEEFFVRMNLSLDSNADRRDYNDWLTVNASGTTDLSALQPAKSAMMEEEVDSAVNFLTNFVLHDISDETKNSFLDSDSEAFPYLHSKSVFIYSWGSKKGETIPTFFQVLTQVNISNLREKKNQPDPSTNTRLQELLRNIPDCESLEGEIKSAYLELMKAGSPELQAAKGYTSCLENALKQKYPEEY